MTTTAFDHTKDKLIGMGSDPSFLEKLAKQLSASTTVDQAKEQYVAFDIEASKLPWPQDHDFGALVLQKEAINANKDIAHFMITQAITRAHYCAQCSTSGGEGAARSKHWLELKKALIQK